MRTATVSVLGSRTRHRQDDHRRAAPRRADDAADETAARGWGWRSPRPPARPRPGSASRWSGLTAARCRGAGDARGHPSRPCSCGDPAGERPVTGTTPATGCPTTWSSSTRRPWCRCRCSPACSRRCDRRPASSWSATPSSSRRCRPAPCSPTSSLWPGGDRQRARQPCPPWSRTTRSGPWPRLDRAGSSATGWPCCRAYVATTGLATSTSWRRRSAGAARRTPALRNGQRLVFTEVPDDEPVPAVHLRQVLLDQLRAVVGAAASGDGDEALAALSSTACCARTAWPPRGVPLVGAGARVAGGRPRNPTPARRPVRRPAAAGHDQRLRQQAVERRYRRGPGPWRRAVRLLRRPADPAEPARRRPADVRDRPSTAPRARSSTG